MRGSIDCGLNLNIIHICGEVGSLGGRNGEQKILYICGGAGWLEPKHDKLILELQLHAILIYLFLMGDRYHWRGEGDERRIFEPIIIGKDIGECVGRILMGVGPNI